MPGTFGNQNARRWSDDALKKVSRIIRETAPHVAAIVSIIVKLDISQDQYYHLVDTHEVVQQAHKYAKSCIASKAWTQAFDGEGYPNILTMAIKRHDKHHMISENKQTKETEKIKGDEKIRTQNALIDDNKDTLTEMAVAAQAIQDINAKKKQGKLED